jgi:hypothetical protein
MQLIKTLLQHGIPIVFLFNREQERKAVLKEITDDKQRDMLQLLKMVHAEIWMRGQYF